MRAILEIVGLIGMILSGTLLMAALAAEWPRLGKMSLLFSLAFVLFGGGYLWEVMS